MKHPHILSLCYYVYKQLQQKDIQNLEKQEREKTVLHIQKSKSKYMNPTLLCHVQ